MGTTYAGDRNGNPIAVKVIEVAPLAQSSSAAEFRDRAAKVSALFHPGVVPLRDYGVAAPFFYAVSGFQIGGSLTDSAARKAFSPPLPIDRIAAFAHQIANALAEAHKVGIVHGNLKPSNLFLAPDRTPHILIGDFPLLLVNAPSVITPFGQRRVWRYLAPEQAETLAQPASDQFALATIVYEWLTGHPAFDDIPLSQRISALPIAQMRPSVAHLEGLDTVFSRAFTSDPTRRYSAITQFATALAEALADKQTYSATVPPSDPYDTRPSPGEIPVPLTFVNPAPLPIQPQTSPSAFLLDLPEIGPLPDVRALQIMADTEERARVQSPNASYAGPVPDRLPLVRQPTTSEQELLAPPALRRRAKSKAANRAAQRSTDDPTIFEQFNVPLPRREVLIAGGKIALAATVTAAGIIGIARNFSGIQSYFQTLHPKPTIHPINVPAPRVLPTLPSAITALAWSPDSSRLVAACTADPSLRFWDASRLQDPATTSIIPTSTGYTDASWAHDSHFLLVCPVGIHASILSLATQQTIDMQTAAHVARWHPHLNIGALLTSADLTTILLWDLAAGTKLDALAGHSAPVQDLAWSPTTDGSALISGDASGALILWTGSTPKALAPNGAPRKEHTSHITAVAWATNGASFASASADGTARLWSPSSSTSRRTLMPGEPVNALAWSPSSAYVALGTQSGAVTLWESATGRKILTLPASGNASITSLSWSSDSARLIAGSVEHIIRVWDMSGV